MEKASWEGLGSQPFAVTVTVAVTVLLRHAQAATASQDMVCVVMQGFIGRQQVLA